MAWGGPALLIPSYVVKCYSWKIPRKPCRGECRTTRPPHNSRFRLSGTDFSLCAFGCILLNSKPHTLKSAPPKNSAASTLLVRLLRFVDVHVLGVNDFARRRGARPGLRPARRSRNSVGGACRASLRPARLRGLVEGLRQGMGGSFELLRRRRDLVEDASGKSRLCRRQCFFHRLDIGFGELLAVFGDQLLDLIHPAVENVPRLDLRQLFLVLIGVGFGVVAHLLGLFLAQTGGRGDRDF